MQVRRNLFTVAGSEIFQQLDAGPFLCPKSGYAQARPEHVVQVFLLCSVVLTCTDDHESEQVAIESKTCFGVTGYYSSMVDAEEEVLRRPMPFRAAFVLW